MNVVRRFRTSLRALSVLVAPLLFGQAEKYEGRRIASIQFSPADQPVDAEELHEILPVKINGLLRLRDVRAAIQRLFATGEYEDIQVDAERAGNDVVIRFITRNSWFIGRVSITGDVPEPPNRGQLVSASGFDLGLPFEQPDVPRAEAGMRKLLTDNGFYENRLEPRFSYDNRTQQIHMDFRVNAGARAKYRRPEVAGDLQMPVEKIISATRWRRWILGAWRPVTQVRTRQGIDRIRERYEKAGRLMAAVDLESMPYDEESRRAAPHLNINAGPLVVVRTFGAKIPGKRLRRDVPIYQEHAVDRDLLAEGQRNLQEDLQSDGYFDAEVEFKQQRLRNNREEIDYLINPGKRHRLVHLEMTGNRYFTTDTLRERIFMRRASLLRFRHGRYSSAYRRRDEETIANLYRENGFRDVSMASRVEDDYKGKPGDIAVFMRIEEGPQWFVSKLEVAGISQREANGILASLSSSEGQPFSEFNVAEDRNTILDWYLNNGFRSASFEWSSRPGPRPNQVDLRYVIVEGKQQFVRSVLISGLRTTRPQLVNRRLSLNPGDPLSQVRMSDIQRQLYELGIFAKVDMAVQNPNGDTRKKYVLFDMDEARKYSLAFGFGAEIARIGGGQTTLVNPAGATGFSPRVSFNVTRLNLLGLGQTLAFGSRFSTLQQRGVINYLIPRFRQNPNLDLSFSTLFDDTRNVRTFTQRREEGSVQLTERLSKSLTAFYRFSYRNVGVSNIKVSPLLFPRSQSVRTGIFSGNFIQDRRDDPTDAHKGVYNAIDLGVATHTFGSQTNFVRFLGRNATYHRIGKSIVFARETQFGVIPTFGRNSLLCQPTGPSVPLTGASNCLADPSDPIPLPERFFGGGATSHRGFPENQAGPRDETTGFPLGGSALLFNSTELRFPLIGDNIGGVLFEDAGNLYASPGRISLRFSQKDLKDFNYMVHALGFGVRYRTPIGPVRVDVAWGINSPRFNGFSGTFTDLLNCTAAGTCEPRVQRISRLQFFFSIGQTF